MAHSEHVAASTKTDTKCVLGVRHATQVLRTEQLSKSKSKPQPQTIIFSGLTYVQETLNFVQNSAIAARVHDADA